jgi:cytosine/adenosine deaminase-related metal-dependent hydrolase
MHPWPPRSADLSPLDYCIWGWLKDIVYQRKAHTSEELLARNMHAATELRDNSVNLCRATCAVHKHADKCIKAEGGILENVL